MRRRTFLISALTAVSTITSGCGSPTGDNTPSEDNPVKPRVEHTDPTLQTDDSPQDQTKYLEFQGDGIGSPTVGVDPGNSTLPNNFLTTISHSENTELQSLTQQFTAPDSDGTQPKLSDQVSFTSDPNPPPSVLLSQNEGGTIVEIDQFGELADETAFISIPVNQWPESARRLIVENTVELIKTGSPDQTHILTGKVEFEFTAETSG